NTSIATINGAGLATGVVAGGPVTIAATLYGVTGSTPLTVGPPVLQSITVSPNSASVAAGLTQQFSATGHYSDSSTANLTSSATWTSSSTSIATVGNTGLATGVAIGGPTTIKAALNGINGTAQLTVTAPLLTSITVTPANPTVPAGTNRQ